MSLESYSQTDYWSNIVYFSGCPINRIPKGITIPDKDNQSRAIMNAIISGASDSALKQWFPDSLDIKISRLVNGGVIRRTGDHYETVFPVVMGEDRIKMKKIIREKVRNIYSQIDSLINPIKAALGNRNKMTFHFLWARIIDDCWWNLYNKEFQTEDGPPSIAFIVSPPHPFQCGTNFDDTPDNGQIAISWSYNLFDEFSSLPSTNSFYNLAMNKSISEKDRTFFSKYGLLDSNNSSRLFIYYEDGKLDVVCRKLKEKYIEILRGLFDYKKISEEFRIPPDELLLVISHEIAYEIFELLNEEKTSMFIPILKDNNPDISFEYLVSIKMPGK